MKMPATPNLDAMDKEELLIFLLGTPTFGYLNRTKATEAYQMTKIRARQQQPDSCILLADMECKLSGQMAGRAVGELVGILEHLNQT